MPSSPLLLTDTLLDGTQPGNPVNVEGNVQVFYDSSLRLTGTINNTGLITGLYNPNAHYGGDIGIQGKCDP